MIEAQLRKNYALAKFSAITVKPQPPKAAMFHLQFAMAPNQLAERITDYVQEHDVVILPLPRSGDESHSICEIPVGRNAMSQPHDFWLRHFTAFTEGIDT